MEEPKIRYALGIQDFEKLRESGRLYVDKTGIMHTLVSEKDYVFLSRPRRFGKSLFMSTLEYYFKGRRDLFEGLRIEGLERDWIEYPVFRFDFSSDSYSDIEVVRNKIIRHLSKWEREYGVVPAVNPGDRLYNVLEAACVQTGRRCVVLVDEYDKPMLDGLADDRLHAAIKEELRGFYSVFKEADRYIRFVMITGVSKFSKVSIFSGLNNLTDISMLPRYNDICGFSESEFRREFAVPINCFSVRHEISELEAWELFRRNYDGYHFALPGDGIYNPYSVMSALDEGEIKAYWYGSGTPGYLPGLIERSSFNLKNLDFIRCDEVALSDISDPERDLVPMLYQAGYLTLADRITDSSEYILRFPNEEVREAFWKSLSRFFFTKKGNYDFDQRLFVDDVNRGRVDDFMTRLKSLLADTPVSPKTDKEVHFQNMIRTVAKMLGLKVQTEVHSSQGRCDMRLETAGYVYIFEFKINSTPEKALAQIKEKGYAEPYGVDDRCVILIGADFSTKTLSLTGWVKEVF